MKKIKFDELVVGQDVWTLQRGWTTVREILYDKNFAIRTTCRFAYAEDGCIYNHDKFPSLYLEPPAELDDSKPPYRFKDGDKVLVWDHDSDKPLRRYFSHEIDGLYVVYSSGGTRWSARNDYSTFKHCILAHPQEQS